MQLRFRLFLAALAVCLFFPGAVSRLFAQQQELTLVPDASATLPDEPGAQLAALVGDSTTQQSSSSQGSLTPPQSSAQSSSQLAAAQDTPITQDPAAKAAIEKIEHEKAEEQLRQQEHQRVAGVMATFNTTTNRNALPLSPGQKFRLFFRSSTDPWPFLLAGVVAGIGQANNSPTEWGQGLQGYAKRFGGNYTDAFIGNFFGNAVLPVLLKEDPRYFQKGSGNPIRRGLWAASSTFWCRRDNGKWGPNYANVGGNMIGSAIARAYYPQSERDVYDTIMDGFTVSVEGIVGAEVIEFWPDLVRHHKRKQAEKLARQAANIGK
jgi:hypothetical protein